MAKRFSNQKFKEYLLANDIAISIKLKIIQQRYPAKYRYALTAPNRIDENLGKTYLMEASESNHTEVAKVFVEAGVDINIADQFGETAIMKAMEKDNIELVKFLIDKGADIHTYSNEGKNLLTIVLEKNRYELAKSLIESGVDVNLQNKLEDNYTYESPLEIECKKNNPNREMIELLLKYGADVNARKERNMRKTPIWFLCFKSKVDLKLVKLLIDYGADLNVLGTFESSILGDLVLADGIKNKIAVIRLLLEHGANPWIKDSITHKTVYDLAKESGRIRLVKIFDEYKKLKHRRKQK
ncbi:MAG: ankyrin repeat domain-containing protein [Candidatus Omnitrophica bacterium]|nr:ankyrin repeat domain-containing protein [Candidatus Omnitrophota bacterium]